VTVPSLSSSGQRQWDTSKATSMLGSATLANSARIPNQGDVVFDEARVYGASPAVSMTRPP
jgi:hypothetical protein